MSSNEFSVQIFLVFSNNIIAVILKIYHIGGSKSIEFIENEIGL